MDSLPHSPRPSLRSGKSSYSSLTGLENVIPPRSPPMDCPSFLTIGDLNRPLPPIPPVPRRASSVYSTEDEDIIDYYISRTPKDELIRPFGFAPPTVANTLRNLYDEDGSFLGPTGYGDRTGLGVFNGGPVSEQQPEWSLQSPRTRSSQARYLQPTISGARSVSSISSSFSSSMDRARYTASVASSTRPMSPKSEPKLRSDSPLSHWQPSWPRKSSHDTCSDSTSASSRPVSPKSFPISSRKGTAGEPHGKSQRHLPRELLPDSISILSGARPVSPRYQSNPTQVSLHETPRRTKQNAPTPIKLPHKFGSTWSPPSPFCPDPKIDYNRAPLTSRVSEIADHAIVSGSLPSSITLDHEMRHHDLSAPISPISGPSTPSSGSRPLSFPRWSHTSFPDRQPSVRAFSYESQWPPQPQSPTESSNKAPTLGNSGHEAPLHSPDEARHILSSYSAKYPSAKPSPTTGNRLMCLATQKRMSLQNQISEMYGTLASVALSPTQRRMSSKFEVTPTTTGSPASNSKSSSKSPLVIRLPLRPKLHRSSALSNGTPREIHRSPAIPMTPSQYVGTKALEEQPSSRSKGKAKKKLRPQTEAPRKVTSPKPIRRFASLVGRGNSRYKDESAEKWREEMKKKIVVMGPGGEKPVDHDDGEVDGAGQERWV